MLITGFGDSPIRMNFDIFTLLRPGAVILTQTSTALVIDTNSVSSIGSYQVPAVFAFTGEGVRYNSDDEPVAGTITGLKVTEADGSILNVTGLHLSAATFFQTIENAVNGLVPADPMDLVFPGNDEFRGSALGDYIYDHVGHNILSGGGGSDSLSGGDGNDHIYGQSPNGGPDAGDLLSGGGGSDYIQGNAGQDDIYGGDGSDRINGGADDDRIFGGSGHDSINGNRGDDEISGESDNDLLRGGQGNDTIRGGSGDDVLMGDLGADRLYGDDGNDIFVFGPGSSALGEAIDRVEDFQPGFDHISLGFAPGAALSGGSSTNTLDAARAAAQALFDQHPGDHEVSLTGGYMFWSANGGDLIDSVALINGNAPTLTDFV